MIRPKNETEDLLFSITKNCETLIDQTHRKAEETLEFKVTKPRETFYFTPKVEFKEDLMIGFIGLQVYNSIFNITEENNKFELFTGYLDDEFSFIELEDKVAEVFGLSNISPKHLQHEIRGPNIIETYRKPSIEKSQPDWYYRRIMDYVHSPIRDFESYLRIAVGLDEDDIQFLLKQ